MIVILNLISLFTWSYSFIRPVRIKYVTTRLKLLLIRHLRKSLVANEEGAGQQTIQDDSLLYRDDSHLDFARNYLKCDGIFVLRLLETNTSDFVVTHVIEELFNSYEKKASQPAVLDGLAKMMSTLGPDQGLLSLGKLLFLPVMSDPKIASSFGGTMNSKMFLPSLSATNDEPLRHAPKILVPPTPTRRRSSTVEKYSPTGSVVEQLDNVRRTSLLKSSRDVPSVDEVTELLRERRQKIKGKKR